eukprot:8087419-Pyramimonas_sp.AAC.1
MRTPWRRTSKTHVQHKHRRNVRRRGGVARKRPAEHMQYSMRLLRARERVAPGWGDILSISQSERVRTV